MPSQRQFHRAHSRTAPALQRHDMCCPLDVEALCRDVQAIVAVFPPLHQMRLGKYRCARKLASGPGSFRRADNRHPSPKHHISCAIFHDGALFVGLVREDAAIGGSGDTGLTIACHLNSWSDLDNCSLQHFPSMRISWCTDVAGFL